MKSILQPAITFALIASTAALSVTSAEARDRGRFYGGLATGFVAGGILGAYAYRPYYSGPYYTGSYYSGPTYYAGPGPYCYKGALRCRWVEGYERCWRPTICD